MIDCFKAQNYFNEKLRMTKKHKRKYGGYLCELNCTDCPLSSSNNGSSDMMSCSDFEALYPEKAIEIVQRWSDEHPQRTYLSELLKIFPNTPLKDDGTPKGICLHEFMIFMPLMNIIVKMMKFYQDLPKLSANLVE